MNWLIVNIQMFENKKRQKGQVTIYSLLTA